MPATLNAQITTMITIVSAIGNEKYHGMPRMVPLWFHALLADAELG